MKKYNTFTVNDLGHIILAKPLPTSRNPFKKMYQSEIYATLKLSHEDKMRECNKILLEEEQLQDADAQEVNEEERIAEMIDIFNRSPLRYLPKDTSPFEKNKEKIEGPF